MPALMRRPEMKEKLANALVDLMEGAYLPENAISVYENLQSQIIDEHRHMINTQRRISEIDREGNQGSWPDWGEVEQSQRQIRDFLNQRPNEVKGHITSELGLSGTTATNFTNSSNGEAVMNTRPVKSGQSVTGNYYTATTINITAKPFPGYIVESWTVDGDSQPGTDIAGAGNWNKITVNAGADVSVTYKRDSAADDAGILITAVKGSGSEVPGWIEITNYSGGIVSLGGMYLSDNNDDYSKWEIPEININSGDTVRIATSNNDSGEIAQTNFNLVFGERLRLSDSQGNVLQTVEIGLMNENQVQRRGDDGRWRITGE